MNVVITDEAQAELEQIGDHVALYDPRAAATLVTELLDRCYRLAATPSAFPLVSRYARFGIRRRVHRDYLIFYRVERYAVVILHIVHGARDYDQILVPRS